MVELYSTMKGKNGVVDDEVCHTIPWVLVNQCLPGGPWLMASDRRLTALIRSERLKEVFF
jgi:hypothetical protein